MGPWDFFKEVVQEAFTPKEANQGEDDWVAGYHAGGRDQEHYDHTHPDTCNGPDYGSSFSDPGPGSDSGGGSE